MKQTFAVIIFLLIIPVIAIYFFIPSKISAANEITTAGSSGTLERVINSGYRIKWLPKEGKVISAVEYVLDGCTYSFPADNSFDNNIQVTYKNITASILVTILPLADSVSLSWTFNHESSNNPVKRVSDYLALKHIKATNKKILQNMLAFTASKKNVYGFDVAEQIQTDSTLISIKSSSVIYPTVNDIYNNIEKLLRYAIANGADTTNAPMLNIEKAEDSNWNYMVALPIDKALPDAGNIIAKRMLPGGKILISGNITGGLGTIDFAMKQLENFKTDNNYKSPAIPFQSLVTDRIKETDTTKWVTKLYYPVY